MLNCGTCDNSTPQPFVFNFSTVLSSSFSTSLLIFSTGYRPCLWLNLKFSVTFPFPSYFFICRRCWVYRSRSFPVIFLITGNRLGQAICPSVSCLLNKIFCFILHMQHQNFLRKNWESYVEVYTVFLGNRDLSTSIIFVKHPKDLFCNFVVLDTFWKLFFCSDRLFGPLFWICFWILPQLSCLWVVSWNGRLQLITFIVLFSQN